MLCELTSRRRVIAGVAAAGLVPLLAPCATRAQQPYTEVSYQSGGLRIQGYFYQPDGSGPFPTLIYNHGSRAGFERRPNPWVRLAGLYVAAGYALLVPERRGYGRSDGPAWSEAVGRDVGGVLIARLQAEADDVLAAVEYLRGVPSADISRLGIAGWSLGGIVILRDFAQPKLSGRDRSSRRRIDVALQPGAAGSADAGGPRCDMPGVADGRAERRRPRGDTDTLTGDGRRRVAAPADHVSAVYSDHAGGGGRTRPSPVLGRRVADLGARRDRLFRRLPPAIAARIDAVERSRRRRGQGACGMWAT